MKDCTLKIVANFAMLLAIVLLYSGSMMGLGRWASAMHNIWCGVQYVRSPSLRNVRVLGILF